MSDMRAVHVLAPSWKDVIESGDSSSATSIKVFLTLLDKEIEGETVGQHLG